MTAAQSIAARREELKLSHTQLAQRLSRYGGRVPDWCDWIERVESGSIEPTANELRAIARALEARVVMRIER